MLLYEDKHNNMPELESTESDELIIRPHHLEGALHGLIAAVHGPQAAGVDTQMEPEVAIAMTFDAEDYILDSTPPEVKQKIEEHYNGNQDFQKIVTFLKEQQIKNPDAPSVIPHGEGYRTLKKAYDADPMGATVKFKNIYDIFCKDCASHVSRTGRPCMAQFIKSSDGALDMDDAVIEAHPWEYDKPYNVGEVLKWLISESTRRRVTMLCADQYTNAQEWSEWERDNMRSKLSI